MPLDFAAAARLFMGTEEELARALGVAVADLRAMRTNPQLVKQDMLQRLATVMEERGRGMVRVGEMLREQ